MKKAILFFGLAFALTTVTSCNKKGCTDSMANNYSSKAKTDDGSCQFDRDAIIGNYLINGTESCSDLGVDTFSNETMLITASSVAKNKVVVNFGGLTISGTVSGTSLIIENQSLDGYTYSGTGSINGNILSLSMTLYIQEYDETCIYNISGNKQ